MSQSVARFDSRPLAGGTKRQRRDSVGGWTNRASGLGGPLDREASTRFVPRAQLPQSEIDALLEFQALARRIVSREPEDAMRKGFAIKGRYTADQVKAIEKAMGALELVDRNADARKWAKAFGGGAVLLGVADGLRMHEPLDFAALRSVRSLTALDRYEVFPLIWQNDATLANFGKASVYMVNMSGGGGGIFSGPVHASRIVRYEGAKLPHRRMVARQGWGGSDLDLVWEELKNYSSSHRFAANAVSLFTQGVLKSPGLSAAIAAGDVDLVLDRLESLRMGMGILGDLTLDAGEDYAIHERTMTGLAQLLERLGAALVAATDMPKTVLFGEQPGGLNASADSEIRAWYDHVGAMQVEVYEARILYCLEVLCRSAEGPTAGYWDPDTALEWEPLYEESAEEKARTRLTNAQARAVDRSSGAVSADELRRDPELSEAYPGFDPRAPAPPPPPAPGGFGTMSADVEDDEGDPEDVIIPSHPSEMVEGEALISAREVASMLGYGSTSPVLAMAAAGAVPAWKVRGRWRFQASSVRQAVAQRSNQRDDGEGDSLPLA